MTHAHCTLPSIRTLSVALAALTLSACASFPGPGTSAPIAARCDAAPSAAESTRLSAIEQLLADGKPYAALAQLDASAQSTTRATHLRAESLRRTGDNAGAVATYQGLLETCLAGQAQHGLGLIAAEQGRLPDALNHLQKARDVLPTDPRVRSDFGYALLLAGHIDRARVEFLTALDLQPSEPKAARNLVLLTFRQGDVPQAESLARRFGLTAQVIAGLRQQASVLAAGRQPSDT